MLSPAGDTVFWGNVCVIQAEKMRKRIRTINPSKIPRLVQASHGAVDEAPNPSYQLFVRVSPEVSPSARLRLERLRDDLERRQRTRGGAV